MNLPYGILKFASGTGDLGVADYGASTAVVLVIL